MALVRRMDSRGGRSMISRNMGLLIGALFLWSFGEGLFFIFQPLYLESYGATPVQIGAILAAASLTLVLVHLPAGYIADRLGRKPVMICGWWLGLLSAAAMFLARDLPMFAIALIVYYSTAFVGSANNSYLTATRGSLSVQRALTLASAAYGAGSIFSPAIGGWMAAHWGMRSAIGAACVLYAASCLVILRLTPQPSEHSGGGHDYRRLLTNQPFCTVVVLAFGAAFSMYLGMALVPNYLQDVRGVSLQQIGILGSVAALGIVAVNILVGRWRPRRGFLISQGVVFIQAMVLWLGTGLGWFAVAFFLRAGLSGARSAAASQAGRVVAVQELGVAYASIETMIATAMALSPFLAGALYQGNPEWPLVTSATLILLMIVLSVRFMPRAAQVEPPEQPYSMANIATQE